MASKYQAFPGMEDILPGAIEQWQWLEEKARIFFEARGYKEIRTPILEPTELFSRSIGEASDIVHKEMYTFEDRGERSMTLRPELTASIARSVIEHGLLKTAKSLRLYYLGPMFRAERPQAGRKRQFHQIGIEIINEAGEKADFESISLLYFFLKYAGLEKISLRLNHLPEPSERAKIEKSLVDYFSKQQTTLCKDCQFRLRKNVMRIFDCKVESCQPVINQAPWETLAPFGEEFETLLKDLEAHGIPFEIKRRLVRGLDYYTGAVFEIAAEGLGAQDAVAGGGRYDGLYAELGGSQTPCTGFSIGIERMLAALEKQGKSPAEELLKRKIYFAPLEASCEVLGLFHESATALREQGWLIENAPGQTSLSNHLKKANQLGLRYVVIVGPDEAKKKKCAVKDLAERTQTEVETKNLISFFEKRRPS